jgi:hypothetical protein
MMPQEAEGRTPTVDRIEMRDQASGARSGIILPLAPGGPWSSESSGPPSSYPLARTAHGLAPGGRDGSQPKGAAAACFRRSFPRGFYGNLDGLYPRKEKGLITGETYQLMVKGPSMPRRPAAVTQADVARTIRAARQVGADSVEVRPDGTIVVVLKDTPASAPTVPDGNPQGPVPQDIIL